MAAGSMGVEKSTKKNASAAGTPPVVRQKALIRVAARAPGENGPRCRVLVGAGTADEHDVTGALTASLAHALWLLRGGVDIANWLDAETLLDQLLGQAAPLKADVPAVAPLPEVVVPGKRPVARR